jgi:hypothetical protein
MKRFPHDSERSGIILPKQPRQIDLCNDVSRCIAIDELGIAETSFDALIQNPHCSKGSESGPLQGDSGA